MSCNEHYPTAWAYEQACRALETHRERANTAEKKLGTLRHEVATLRTDFQDIVTEFSKYEDQTAIESGLYLANRAVDRLERILEETL
jgi:hypothetical protein